MYDRTVDGTQLNFQVSGKLWNRSLVMSDEQTGSLWSHLLGKSMAGELEGKKLVAVPSVITSWSDWKSSHPETKVMIWPSQTMQKYDTSFFDRRGTRPVVIGYVDGQHSKSYSYKALKKTPMINDFVDGRPILIWFEPSSGACWCFERNVGDRILTFKQTEDGLVDLETSTTWDAKSGIAMTGMLKGQILKPRVVIPSYEFAWKNFYPESTEYSEP